MSAYDATFSQYLIWMDQLRNEQSSKYNIGGYCSLEGNLSHDCFRRAVTAILQNQEIYSTVFAYQKERLQGVVKSIGEDYELEILDFSGFEDAEERALRWMQDDFAIPFELKDQYLFYFKLIKISDDLHFWYAKVHHLISDGWSFMLLLNQTARLYSKLSNGVEISPSTYQYSDYAEDDRAYWSSEQAEKDRQFWMDQYEQLPPTLFQPLQNGDSPEVNISGSDSLSINNVQKEQLNEIAAAHKVSLFQLIAGYLLIYFSLSRQQEEISLGIPVLNRGKRSYRFTAGVFMNLLALRFKVSEKDTLGDLLSQVKGNMRQYLRHQRYQYGKLLRDLHLGVSERSLYQIRISYEDFSFTSNFGDLGAKAVALSNHSETDPLSIYLRDYHEEGFDIRFVYNTEYFDEARIAEIKQGLAYLLTQAPADEAMELRNIELLEPEQLERIKRLSAGKKEEREQSHFLSLWKQSVQDNGHSIALSDTAGKWTYRETDQRAARVANMLLAAREGRLPARVALLLPRSKEMISGLLGCMLAGDTYIPLETEDPDQRLRHILEDASSHFLLTSRSVADRFSPIVPDGCKVLYIEDALEKSPMATDREPIHTAKEAAYIIYTSGSTGTPKGVVISHGSLADYTQTVIEHFQLSPKDIVLQQAALSFDTSVEEIFPVLAAGGSLHILENRGDLFELQSSLEKEKITFLSTSPMVVQLLNEGKLPSSLRILISGGDVLKADYISKLRKRKGLAIYNTYGPTESTVCATYHRIDPEEQEISIGKPISNREVYILNKRGNVQPLYTPGEICIAGSGLALIYLNQPALTAARFVPHPFDPSRKIYRSGDVGYMDADGRLFFLGRNDAQLKIRGYRIEKGEIESALDSIDSIKRAVIAAETRNGEEIVAAYIQPIEGISPDPAVWKQKLSQRLPKYMIPAVFRLIEAWPLLPSGKIAVRELPGRGKELLPPATTDSSTPLSRTAVQLHELWQQLLGIENILGQHAFFELGGNSITAARLVIRIREQFGKQIDLSDIFRNDRLDRLAEAIDQAPALKNASPEKAEEKQRYPLTHAQERIWLLSQIDEAAIAYNICGAVKLERTIDFEVLNQAVIMLMDRHDSLRTVFREDETGTPYQMLVDRPQAEAVLDKTDITDDEAEMEVQLSTFSATLFNLNEGPLFRVLLVQRPEGSPLLAYCIHHLISDGWSMEILARELMLIYNGLLTDRQFQMPAPAYQFRDFIAPIRAAGSEADSEQYWLNKFAEPPTPVQLPVQKTRRPFKTFSGTEISLDIDRNLSNAFEKYCNRQGSTLFMGLMAVLNTLIYKYTAQQSTVIGAPVANRDQAEKQDQIGLFLNVLPIRTEFEPGAAFEELLARQRETLQEAYRFNNYPMDKLIQKLPYAVDRSRSPLFDILIVLHNQSTSGFTDQVPANNHARAMHIKGRHHVPKQHAQFDMSFAFFYEGEKLQLRLEYNTDLFAGWFARQIVRHFVQLMEVALENPKLPLETLPILSKSESNTLRNGGLQAAISSEKTALQHFLDMARRYPDRMALAGLAKHYSYRELEWEARHLAAYLLKTYHLEPNDRVAVLLQTSEAIPIAMLAIWMLGGTYVPINVSYPGERINSIVQAADCRLTIDRQVIEAARKTGTLPEVPHIESPGTAYILFTSGTTGKPKGVAVSHSAIADKLMVENEIIGMSDGINTCLLTNYAFDVSFLELLPPLMTGGKLLIPPADFMQEPESLFPLLERETVNVLHGTPTFIDSLFRYMPSKVAERLNEQLHCICLGGESLNHQLVQHLRSRMPDVTINNLYGPTEAVIHATANTGIREFPRDNIGHPMPGVRAYVLDQHLHPVPKGVQGELYVGGKNCLAEGYLDLPDENRRKFIANPFFPDERLYRTGDMVIRMKDGSLEFLGRSDRQIKIRGFRVELGEIRQTLEGHPQILQAAVSPHGTGDNRKLLAFVLADTDISASAILAYLARFLPKYMIPAQIIPVKEIPTDRNGKIDYGQLLQHYATTARSHKRVAAPRNELDEQLLHIWKQVLKTDGIGIHDNFFDLGGNSILLIRLRAELQQAFGIEFKVRNMLELLSVRQLSDAVATILHAREEETKVPVRDEEVQEFTI